MKKILLFLTIIIPSFVGAESITSFDVDIDVNLDGSINVTETIEYDFEDNQKRGIFRDIPTTYSFEGETRRIDIDLVEVKRNGKEDIVLETKSSGEWRVRIGEEKKIITGEHEYIISYKVKGALRYFSDVDELYWNITGSQWEVPIISWGAQIKLPNGVLTEQSSCFQGKEGAKNTCVITSDEDKKWITFASTRSLFPGEGATGAIGFTPDVVQEVVLLKEEPRWYGMLGVLAAIIFYIRSLVGIKRKHLRKKSVITQYDTYEDYSAMFSGFVIDGILSHRDITAGIIELAQKGYISITQHGKDTLLKNYDYIFTLEKQNIEELTKPQRKLITFLFGASPNMKASYDTSSRKKLSHAKLRAVQTAIGKQMTQYKLDEGVKYPWQTIGVTLAVLTGSMVVTFGVSFIAFIPILFVMVWLFVIPIMVMKRMTQKGYEAVRHTEGLKQYIEVAEEKRVEFHDAPEKNPETFSQYLPYAVAFGLEEKWVEEFKDLDIELEWLRDSTGSTLPAQALSNSLSSVSGALSSSIPSASSSSSGSGGGGFSGGGSGGGGGGSW